MSAKGEKRKLTGATPCFHQINMFDGNPKARADLKSGTLYAVSGEHGWIYYGQVTPDKRIGFFRRRDRQQAPPPEVLGGEVMAVVGVNYPSITRALRSGGWCKLGRFPLACALQTVSPMVLWSVGTLVVSVIDAGREYETRVDDPAIQTMEIAASWDAEQHIPARLTADFGVEEAPWHIGGPVWRQRRVKEGFAQRFPDAPWHQLPPDWVSTDDC